MADDPSFTLQIVFTGVCSLMTDRSVEADPPPEALHLVLLDAWHTERKTEKVATDDREFLFRHGAMVQFPLRNLEGSKLTDGLGVWYPNRHRLIFNFVEESGAPNNFRIVPETIRGHVANMVRIAPDFARIDRDIIGNNPPRNVLANAVFTRGELSSPLEFVRDWRFSGTLASQAIDVDGLAFEITLTLSGLTRMTLTAEPFLSSTHRPGNPGSGLSETLHIVGRRAGDLVKVNIINLCDENSLIWPVGGGDPPPEDHDFKWHYEILSAPTRASLKNRLRGAELPFPILRRGPQPLGNGRNCVPAFWVVPS